MPTSLLPTRPGHGLSCREQFSQPISVDLIPDHPRPVIFLCLSSATMLTLQAAFFILDVDPIRVSLRVRSVQHIVSGSWALEHGQCRTV
ncbi:hypothetical protein RRG08_031355 [Elysia crispata]|uniref:Uncharacterized protein n=1 Tax=Elysia crispata TaxID=231223 RepID=A0AAE0YI50_9GAST|nr:hypothetical protein RRG08_031355 [Elysia crispata]